MRDSHSSAFLIYLFITMANTESISETKPTRIIIIDDHPPIIQSLCAFLETVPAFKVVDTARNMEEARLIMQKNEADVVIMDIRLPRTGHVIVHDAGIDLAAEFNNLYPDLAILMYSGETNVELVRRAKDAGARGYLLKGADVPVIKQAIEIIMAGGLYIDPDLPEKPKPSLRGETLTPKEVQVMRLLANWMTREQIGQELGIVPATVNCHCNNIMWKLDLNSTPELYKEAVRRYGESR